MRLGIAAIEAQRFCLKISREQTCLVFGKADLSCEGNPTVSIEIKEKHQPLTSNRGDGFRRGRLAAR